MENIFVMSTAKSVYMKDPNFVYLLEPGDPAIDKFAPIYGQLNDDDVHTLNLDVNVKDVEAGNVSSIQRLLMVMQHHPHLIGKMLFSVNFNFTEVAHSQLYIAEAQWKTEPVYYKWFHELVGVPFILFFIADEDSRFYALAADILASGEVDAVADQSDGRMCITFTMEQTRIIEERLFNACCSLLLFCSGSGFNPKIYIEGMMALMNVSFVYEDVLQTCSELLQAASPGFIKRSDAA